MKNILRTLTAAFRSRYFFYGVMVFFVFESLWIALSSLYPMAFDEDFHVGIIQIYSAQWSPFLPDQPQGADAFGALARDPSYLFHYLMSFPYRIVRLFTDDQAIQVILLRCLNIAFFAGGLVLFRRMIVLVTKSPALAHVGLLLFVLIPIVPQLAGQINYDNLLFLLMGWLCLLLLQLCNLWKSRRLDIGLVVVVFNLCLLMSLVKYAFLPIFAAVVVFLAGYILHVCAKNNWRAVVRRAFSHMSRTTIIGLSLLTLVSGILFVQRFGVNTIVYRTPVVDCGKVLSYDHCKSYGPWIRNYNYAQTKQDVNESLLSYTGVWLRDLHRRLFFAVNGPASGYANYRPLPIPYVTAGVLVAISVVLVLLYAKKLFTGQLFLQFSLLAIVLYCGALWIENYSQYIETGQPVAINGRYLIPVIPLWIALAGRAFQLALKKHQLVKPILASVVIVLFLQGGGLLTFIIRSDASWYWSQPTVLRVNQEAQRLVSPLIVEGRKVWD